MLNRRHIRIKVMQNLFAYNTIGDPNLKNEERFLLDSLKGIYDLYLLMLSLFIEIQNKAEDHLNKSKRKHLATSVEKNPSRNFVNNQILMLLKNNKTLDQYLKNRNIDNWQLDNEYIDILFKEIIKSEFYKDYMLQNDTTFKADKQFIINVFKHIIAPNEKLYNYLEDKKLTWLDDFPIVNTYVIKLLQKVKPEVTASYFTPELFKDAEDKAFALGLFYKTKDNHAEINREISSKTQNWDSKRIALLDAVLLQMAICEFKEFPSIPTKVTINEYIEIAKEYSTPKSSIFVNGILDKVVKDYEAKGVLNKSGRGLL